jgi:hypothetical protein
MVGGMALHEAHLSCCPGTMGAPGGYGVVLCGAGASTCSSCHADCSMLVSVHMPTPTNRIDEESKLTACHAVEGVDANSTL